MSAPGGEPLHAGPADRDHIVQLFDGPDSYVETVAAFLHDGWVQGHTLAVVVTAAHWAAIGERLVALGVPIDVAAAEGRLTVRGADEMLQRFMRAERPDPARFRGTVARLVRDLVSRGRPVRIVGEMVEVLAGAGNFDGAEALEVLWNELRTREPFTLLCAYDAATFGDPRSGDRLRRICATHSQVWSNPRDLLGSFLLATHACPGL